jgi:iron-sulfur cluster assembly protein
LKFDKAKSEDDKIFIDNKLKMEKIYWNNIRVLRGINGKGFIFNNPNANRTCGCGEFLFKTKSFESTI